ncbi:SRPBCC family protein [Nonomuraea sp. K274]|uniref:SRPBCC family protein n=1 Tax=Nonomuraea cypriaca TaxID=1187855 RepID=A0A931ASY0_9ACTN|nr:SRPBCC family protein [Nonomuraea cypriaca]MBF8194387.1 SRPBCC family protein [Nonomuraea cypriaca]
MNENLTLHPDGRTTLRMQRRLPHPPAKVWRAITEPQHLAHWFPAEVTIDGDRIGYGEGPDGRITEMNPPHVFAHTWQDDELRWEIHPDGEGSILTLTHTFPDRHGAASFASGWHTCILALLASLDGRSTAPYATVQPADFARIHEDYIAILGLDPVAAADDTAVRLERQLARPADEIWHLLHGGDATPGTPPPAAFTAPGVQPGPVTRTETGKLLEYDTPGGSVRWELAQGTGQGARLVITHSGADTSTVHAWRVHVAEVAATVAG